MTNYLLVRSNRKTVAIHITSEATVEVRAPFATSKEFIDKFVLSKEKWIKEHINRQSEKNATKCNNSELKYGSEVLFFGNKYPIVSREGGRVGFDGKEFYVPNNLSTKEIEKSMEQIYKMLSKKHMPSKTLKYADIMEVMPKDIKISSATKRWGSCSNKKVINYTWRLIMLPEQIVDYVVVHELAHLTELNHSSKFWDIVDKFMPDYKERVDELVKFSVTL